MIGRFLNTLRYRLNLELCEWHKTNLIVREYTWPWLQRALVAAGKRPVRRPLALCISVLALSATLWGYHAIAALLSVDPPSLQYGSKQHFFTLWTLQATIAAMIYPIVIGFVTLLLQRRHSAKAGLHIYLHDSAAILTGLSALFLVATMGVQFLCLGAVGETTIAAWLILDGLWFLVNVVGVIWFLTRTFDYLRPERRANIMRAYALNYVWPEEVRRNLEYHLFLGAIQYGWLPGPIYGDKKAGSKTAILPGPVGRNMGNVRVTEKRKGAWTVSDVRFLPLSLAVRSWQRREEYLMLLSNEKPDTIFGERHSRLLILPSVPGESFESEVGLCRTEGGSGLRWWERSLVRWSFVFSPTEDDPSALSISDLLNGLITEVQIAMEAGEEVVFREALQDLVELHVNLIQAGDFKNNVGQHDNYANLADRGDVFEARIHNLWVREYRRLMDAAVARLAVSDVYFNRMVHVSGWLISRLGEIRPVAIQTHLLHLPRSLHYRLNRWWSKTGEEQGTLYHGPCEPATLRAPAFSTYESVIKQFVGAWESLKNDRFPPTRDDQAKWGNYGEYAELYTAHLDGTLYMLFDSLSLGNKEGAEWLCDTLIKWWNTIRFRFDHAHFYIRDERSLTLELVYKPWEEAKNVIDLSMGGIDEANAPKALWAACVHNYWIDLCCVSLYASIQLGKDCVCQKSIPAQLIAALARGKALRAGGEGIGERWPLQTVEDLFIAIIRQYYYDGGYYRGYRARLDKVVEGISSQGKAAMVPGRIYSGWGMENLDALRDGQLVLLCLFVNDGWSPTARFLESILKWGEQDDDGLRAFVDRLGQWKTRLAEADFHVYDSLYSCIQLASGDDDDFGGAIASLDSGVDKFLENIEDYRLERLRNAQVSDTRLREMARWASQSGFSKDTADVPVSLFYDVQHSEEEYEEHSLIIQGVNKGEYVEPGMAQRVSDEDEWLDRTVSGHVAASVMADMLKSLNPEIVDVDSPAAYWQQIKIAAVKIRNEGGVPILFVASRAEPRWLMDWTRSSYDEHEIRPGDLRIVRDKQYEGEGYVGSLNDIPVYVGPIGPGSSYLVPKETLDVILFTEFEGGVFVQASYEPVEGKDTQIDLRLSWRFQLNLKKRECWQLRYVVI